MPRNAIPLGLLFGGLLACIWCVVNDFELAFMCFFVLACIGWQEMEGV